jgi:hypothetical protein
LEILLAEDSYCKYKIKRLFRNGQERFYIYRKQFLFYKRIEESYLDLKSAIKNKVEMQRIQDDYRKKKKEVKQGWVSEDEIKVEVL